MGEGMERFRGNLIGNESEDKEVTRRDALKKISVGAGVAGLVGSSVEAKDIPKNEQATDGFLASEILPVVTSPENRLSNLVRALEDSYGSDSPVVLYAKEMMGEVEKEKKDTLNKIKGTSRKEGRTIAQEFNGKYANIQPLLNPRLTKEQVLSAFTAIALDREVKKACIQACPTYATNVLNEIDNGRLPFHKDIEEAEREILNVKELLKMSSEDKEKKLRGTRAFLGMTPEQQRVELAKTKQGNFMTPGAGVQARLHGFPLPKIAIQKAVSEQISLWEAHIQFQKKKSNSLK